MGEVSHCYQLQLVKLIRDGKKPYARDARLPGSHSQAQCETLYSTTLTNLQLIKPAADKLSLSYDTIIVCI